MPIDQPELSLPRGLYTPIKCKMTVFGSVEVEGRLTLVKDDYAHFISNDERFQVLVHREALKVTALPTEHPHSLYHVYVAAATQIKALRRNQHLGEEWHDIGTTDGFNQMTYQGKPLKYLGEEETQ